MRASRRELASLVVVVTAVAVWANIGAQPPSAMHAEDGDCPHSYPDVQIDIVDEIDEMPEFHDCQRFIVRDTDTTLRYDSVFTILASSKLPILEAEMDSADAVERAATRQFTPNAAPVFGMAVVRAKGRYEPLGIRDTLSCLFAHRSKTTSGERWRAWMVPVKNTDTCLPTNFGAIKRVIPKELEVRRAQVDNFDKAEDYPAVARWDWDSSADEQYISIACGKAWCEIGDFGFSASEPLPVSHRMSREEKKVRRVKGWHDRQLLAIKDDSGKLIPSRVTGIILPDTLLGTRKVDDFRNKRVEVAQIILASPLQEDEPVLDAYKKKINADKPDKKGPITVALENITSKSLWNAHVKRPRSGIKTDVNKDYRSTRRTPEQKIAEKYGIPGVVRWRWLKVDEGMWIRCAEGCCEVTG